MDEDPSPRNGTAPEREASHRALHTIVRSVQCCAADMVIFVTYRVIPDATRKRAGTPCRSIRDESRGRAADFGLRRVDHAVIDARRNLSGFAGVGIPIILELHRFFVASSRAVVNHDDCAGTAPDPFVWSAGVFLKRRRILDAVRDYALLGPAFIWTFDWVGVLPAVIAAEDVYAWRYSVFILVKWATFLGTLCWPAAGADLGVGGKDLPRYRRAGRPISVSTVP